MEPTTNDDDPLAIVDQWIAFKDRIDAETYALGRIAFEVIAQGRPPTIRQMVGTLGRSADDIRRAADRLAKMGLLTMAEPGGRITGSFGLTVDETEYQIDMNGHRLFAWCALDAVGIPAALGANATVTAPVAGRRQPLQLRFADGRIHDGNDDDVRVSLPDAHMDAHIRQEVCPNIALYQADAAPRHPGVALLSLDDAVAMGQRMWRDPRQAGGGGGP